MSTVTASLFSATWGRWNAVASFEAPANQTFSPATAASGPIGFGPYVASTTAPADLTAYVLERVPTVGITATPVAELTDSFGRQWQDQLNEPGSGSLSLMNDDPALGDINDGDLIRFHVKGRGAFCMIAQDWDIATVDEGEEGAEFTTISGPGHLAILEEALVYPTLGPGGLPIEEDRLFSWSSPEYSDDGWGAASEITSTTTAWWSGVSSWPKGLASGFGKWIWGPSGSTEWAPQGDCFFRTTFTPSYATKAIIYLIADDRAHLYLDGQLLIKTSNWSNTGSDLNTVNIELSAEEHTLAVWAQNNNGEVGNNPAGIRVSINAVDALGVVGSSPLVQSDSSWKALEYPLFPPGMTPGQVMAIVLLESVARGCLTVTNYHFNTEVDSDGTPWPVVADIATKVGTDLLTFFREMSATYIDFWMAPSGLDLYAWVKDGRGDTKSVTLQSPTSTTDPTSGNLVRLNHKRVAS